MKIVKFERIQQDIKVDTTRVMKELKKLNTTGRKLQPREIELNKLTKRYLKEIEEQLNMEKKNLYLNETFMAEKIGSTNEQARRIKRKIQSVGGLVMARKQTGPGNYPLWFFNFEYVTFINKETIVEKKKRKAFHEIYNPSLVNMRAEAELEIMDYFEDIEESNRWSCEQDGVEYTELVITAGLYYGMINKRLSEKLSDINKVRADFKI